MANFTDYMENLIINWMRGTAVTQPSSLVIALFVGGSAIESNLEQGIITRGMEIVGGNYTRKAITLTVPDEGTAHNSAEIAWNVATANWGTITHFAIIDNAGNMLMWAPLTTPRTVNSGDIFKFTLGSILLMVD